MESLYQAVPQAHFIECDQMAFVSGPKQVGKTTIADQICGEADYCKYLNRDNVADRIVILGADDELVAGP